VPLSDVAPRRVAWLWAGRVPLGAITVLEGDPASGKSTVTYDLAARVTRGHFMPGCHDGAAPAGVVVLQAEDDLAATVRPRMEAAGADLGRVIVYDRARFSDQPMRLPADLGLVEAAAAEAQARLVIIDPLDAFFTVNLQSQQGAREALTPLAAFAELAGVAVILVRHLRKQASRSPLYRGAGSIAITGIARSALVVGPDPDREDSFQHVIAPVKSNLAQATSLAYRTVLGAGGVITVAWLGASRRTAYDLASAAEPAERRKRADAAYFLYDLLRDGPVAAREALRAAADAGVARRTLERALSELKIERRKDGFGPGSSWLWALPEDRSTLRAVIERDEAERLRRVRREVARRRPGEPWEPPAHDAGLYIDALADRGLTVVFVGGRRRLLRAEDVRRVPVLEETARSAAAGDAGAAAAFADQLAEMGMPATPPADWCG
jgi:hypothetical protein